MLIRTIFFVLLFCSANELLSQTLIPYRKANGKFIYVDSITKKPVITTEFSRADFFTDGLAYAWPDEMGMYIIIDKTGKNARVGTHLLGSKFDENGHANYKEGEFEGLIDIKGKIIVPAVYDEVMPFYENKITRVKLGGQYGFVDRNGTLVISPQFDSWNFFSEGVAFVQEKGEGSKGMFGSDGKWGAINEDGNQVLPFIYDEGGSFKNGKAIVQKDGAFTIIDRNGNVHDVPGNYTIESDFANGFARISKGGKKGYLNEKLKVVVPVIYDSIDMMNVNGRAAVALKGKWGAVDTNGRLVIPCKYEKFEPFNSKSSTEFISAGKKGVLHMDGKEILPAIYDDVYVSDGGFIYFQKNKKWGVMDQNGKVLVEPVITDLDLFTLMFSPTHGNTFMFDGAYRTVEGVVYAE